jgi:hypothetical protein
MKRKTNNQEEHEDRGVFSTNSLDGIKVRHFSVQKMIDFSMKLPTIYTPLDRFRYHMELFCWRDERGNPISPRMVLEDARVSPFHAKRILTVDLAYPILVSEDRMTIYDGMHRLAKAFLQKHYFYIKVVFVRHSMFLYSEINISF